MINEVIYNQFERWLLHVLKDEPPSELIRAYNFGIFESDSGYQIYIAGFQEFDQEDEDWACGFGDYSPVDKYFPIGYTDPEKIDWTEVQNDVAEMIRTFIKGSLFKTSILSHASIIASGFDDGDLIKII